MDNPDWRQMADAAGGYPSLDKISAQAHDIALSKGMWVFRPEVSDTEILDKFMAKLALAHSEFSEVLEAIRKGKGSEAITEEFADVLIRTLDLFCALKYAGYVTDSLQEVFDHKMLTNSTRPHLHGHKWG